VNNKNIERISFSFQEGLKKELQKVITGSIVPKQKVSKFSTWKRNYIIKKQSLDKMTP